MDRFLPILSWGFVLVLGSAGIMTMLFPAAVNEPAGFNAITDYGLTNVRTLGAPTLALAITTAIGTVRKEWILILPAAMYFLFNATARFISVLVDGYSPVMFTGLMFTSTMFALAAFVVWSMRTNTLLTVQPDGAIFANS